MYIYIYIYIHWLTEGWLDVALNRAPIEGALGLRRALRSGGHSRSGPKPATPR